MPLVRHRLTPVDHRQWWVDYFILHGHTRKAAEAKVSARWPAGEPQGAKP